MSDTICVVPIPGPPGTPGADGDDGAAGVSAYTTTTAGFVMPAEGGTVDVSMVNTSWIALENYIFIRAGGAKGFFQVLAKPSANVVTVENIESTSLTLYPDNSPPGTIFPSGSHVVIGGLQGPAGVDGISGAPTSATYIVQTPNGSLSAEQPLSALATGIVYNTTATGVLSIATDGTHYLSPTTGLEPSDIGVSVQAFDAGLTSLAALPTVADRYAYSTALNVWAEGTITAAGRAILDDADAAAQRNTLGVLGGYGLLTSSDAVNLNSATTDTAVTVNATRYLIDKVTLENPSAAVTTAEMGLFTAAGGGGVTLCANQGLNGALTATTKIMHLTKQAIVDTDSRTDGTLYIRVGAAEGAARTVNVKIYGWKYA